MPGFTPDGWVAVSCKAADAIRHAPSTRVGSAKTDLGGTYGRAEVFTEWERDGVPVLREHRWPDPAAVDDPIGNANGKYPDPYPCEHYVPKD